MKYLILLVLLSGCGKDLSIYCQGPIPGATTEQLRTQVKLCRKLGYLR